MIGIGLRRVLSEAIIHKKGIAPDFIEFAPENWMGIGGYWRKQLKQVVERYPVFCHGLSLSIGSPEPPDKPFLGALKKFLDEVQAVYYSEHLSFSKVQNAHLYELFPIPFTEEAIKHVVKQIRYVQEVLERPLVIENISYYTAVTPEMDEATFLRAILEESDCLLLLDVNNVYVNAFNHGYDPMAFISALPLERVAYIHIAGHEQVEPSLIIDTHGQPVIAAVYELLEETLKLLPKEVPILLERDFNIPPAEVLQGELNVLKAIKDGVFQKSTATIP